jgi:hypothetical protein
MIRFAGTALGPLLARLGPVARASIPQTTRGMIGDVAPNLLFAGLSAASLPEGTSPGLRAGAFAEDMLTSVPLSWAGRGLGYAGARAAGRLRGRPLSEDSFNLVQNLSGGGAEAAAWGLGLVPRPFANQAFEQYNARMQSDQLEQQALREMEIRNQTISELGGAGLLVAPIRQAFADPFGGLM